MKKTIAIILIFLCIACTSVVFASETGNIDEKNINEVTQIKSKIEEKKDYYIDRYGSDSYWFTGYILEEIVQPYSIPLCFLGITVGLIFQFVLGTRRLDYKHRGFSLVVVFVTILLVCQLLPFIYALVILGWRG